jgi:hypothetical protein
MFAPTRHSGKQPDERSDRLSSMASTRPVTWLVALALLACAPRPAEFRVVDIDEARRLVQDERLVIVEVPADSRAARSEVPAGAGVLVFGLDAKAARARAATFARAGNRPVIVFIPRDADERGRFYAVASQRQEDRRGKDS